MNLKEFESWALAQKSVGNPTAEGSYKGECVSLVQQYLNKVHGLEFKARGNAKDWVNIVIDGFNRYAPDNTLKPGDIIVYDWGRYGHIAIVTADGKSLEQNKNGNRVITVGDVTPGYVMIHRPAKIDVGIEEKQEVFRVRVDKEKACVRTEPNNNANLVIQPSGRNYLIKGVIFNAIDIVEGQDPYGNGNNKWYKSQKGNYVWSGGLTRL